MGLLLSILNTFANFFVSIKYSTIDDGKNHHISCRSTNPNKLISYQSKIDNLKSSDIVYVNKINYFLIYLKFSF